MSTSRLDAEREAHEQIHGYLVEMECANEECDQVREVRFLDGEPIWGEPPICGRCGEEIQER